MKISEVGAGAYGTNGRVREFGHQVAKWQAVGPLGALLEAQLMVDTQAFSKGEKISQGIVCVAGSINGKDN